MLDYLNKQVVYIPSITHFKYFTLFGLLGILSTFLSAYYNKIGPFKKFRPLQINGLVVLVLILTFICSITFAYNQFWKAPLDYTNYLHLIGKGVFTIGCSYLLILSTFSIGNLLRARMLPQNNDVTTFALLDICLGFVIYTFIMMILGAMGLLDKYVLLAVIVLLILANYKPVYWFIKKTLWSPFKKPQDLNFWGGFIAFFTLVYVTMNYLYTQAPYPLGFDARNYYVNISKLIAESGTLIEGFQPYAWSLVMSTGYIAFESPEITLFISALGGILSLFAIYHFCTKYIGLTSNYAFAVVLLYLVTPTVTNHFIIEFKIDLALLFFQMVTILFVLWWMFDMHQSNDEKRSLLQSKKDLNAIAIIGMLLGYCLSIKVLGVFLLFGIFVGIWWYQRDIWGVIGLCAISIGIVLIVGLDSLSGLRDYHLSPVITGVTLSILGSVCLIISFLNSRTAFLNSLKILTICGVIALLTFSPWIYKNYSFTKSTSIIKLFIGEKPRPVLTLDQIDKNYRQFLEENN